MYAVMSISYEEGGGRGVKEYNVGVGLGYTALTGSIVLGQI